MGIPNLNTLAVKLDTDPLPDEDVVDDGATTEYNSETNDDGGDYSRCLVEMEKGEENNSWQKRFRQKSGFLILILDWDADEVEGELPEEEKILRCALLSCTLHQNGETKNAQFLQYHQSLKR